MQEDCMKMITALMKFKNENRVCLILPLIRNSFCKVEMNQKKRHSPCFVFNKITRIYFVWGEDLISIYQKTSLLLLKLDNLLLYQME